MKLRFSALILFLAVMAQLALPQQASAPPGQVRVNSKDGLKYVWIPPGTFMMGCSPGDNKCHDSEMPSHRVTITKGFWLGQTPATVGGYKRFAKARGRSMPPEPDIGGRALNPGWRYDAMPIVDVTWDEAQAYCSWVGGRLPTEAEWEYAARGGSTEARYGPLDDVAWYADNSGLQRFDCARMSNETQENYGQRLKDNGNGMHEVGLKRPNGFGLFDTLGNVWEWVGDWYDVHYYQTSPSQDPSAPLRVLPLRVLRGGCWSDCPWFVRVSGRNFDYPRRGEISHSFRCAGDVINP
jgi:formylglycine-generating enzyme required for sulfatase activity